MYDNSTPNDGQTSNSRGNLVPVTESNPCPHCGKPDWCYFIGELSVCNRPQYPPPAGWEATSKTDKDGKIYYAPIREKKAIRPRQTRYWEYPARDGSPLVRVVRFDDGEGGGGGDKKKPAWHQERWNISKIKNKNGWVPGIEGIAREDIPIYRYAEIQKAIERNELIFIVEGEACADILWKLGLAATCNIGGSEKWRSSDTSDLQGARIVIVPDRDQPGIKHAELLHQEFPDALWLYPFPESKAWENLPKSQGLDIADWVEHHKITSEDIKAVIGEKKIFNVPAPTPQSASKVVRPAQFQVPEISELGGEIEALLNSDLKKSQLQLKISELAQKFRMTSADVWKIYRERELELEQEASQEDTRIGIDQLLASQAASVKLSEIFPESLATPIELLATRMNLKPECYALALISGVSRFLKNGSSTMLVEEWNRYRCRTHGYFGVMIAEASQMKTPVLNAMIADPLAAMRENNQRKFEAQKKAYEVELEQWKNSKDEDKGPAPDAPVEKFAYITKATWEGIAGMVGRAPTQGILWLCDELAGFFNSANQYRSGKGSDKEDLLECWSGNGAVIARAAGTTVNVGAVSLSIYGNIQPKVLAPFLGDGSDDNGTFARFDFVQQPPALTQITLGLSKIDINPMLQALYERVDAIPVTEFALDEEARKLFVDYYNHCQRLRLNHPKQGMRAMLGKAAEKVGRVATILHSIHAAHLGGEVSPKIPASRVAAAIKWVEYTTQQALSVNIEVCSPDALESNLAKIISLAERKGGTATVRDIQLSFDSKYGFTAQKIREWLQKLVEMNYGEVTQKGNSIRFSLTKSSTPSTVAQDPSLVRLLGVEDCFYSTSTPSTSSTPTAQEEVTVEDCRGTVEANPLHLKPCRGMELKPTVESVEGFLHSPENSDSLMLSHTTEPAQFTDEALASMLADEMRQAIAKNNRKDAAEVIKQVANSAPGVSQFFFKSFTKEENLNIYLLRDYGVTKGTRVEYVGKDIEQYAGEVLTVESINSRNELACLRPDGKGYTTWLKSEDLRKL
jgi:hypothetical protein